MYKKFDSLEALFDQVEADKRATGVGAANLDRYPIRFVLFDDFQDNYAFVEYLQKERSVRVESVDKWTDSDYPDLLITQQELASRIAGHIKKQCPKDCLIAPFSELARFYDNKEKMQFDALVRTVKAIEATPDAVACHQRVYIPIVGLEGKMESFQNDSQINVWQFASEEKKDNYRLIVTQNKDFGVKGLEANFTVVNNISEWLRLWQEGNNIKKQIICRSRSIFANAANAQPDNAFSYAICDDAFSFLKSALPQSFGGVEQKEGETEFWTELAEEIDVSKGFDFQKHILSHFLVNDIPNYESFLRLWFAKPSPFDRWLLVRYYVDIKRNADYLSEMLASVQNYGTTDFVEKMTLELSENETQMKIRRCCLLEAIRHGVGLSDAVASLLSRRLSSLSEKKGCSAAMKYFTGICRKEKEIVLRWVGEGAVSIDEVKPLLPDLYHYMKEGVGSSVVAPHWVDDYFTKYKKAKTSNLYTEEISSAIHEKSASEALFDTWYNDFQTTYTLLKERDDIEVFFWIDGLGADWIPLVKQIVEERKSNNIFLNEVKLARAKLPTKTDVNKADLQRLLPEGVPLEKMGDLDALAHKTTNTAPYLLLDELETVRAGITKVLDRFVGKKVAIVSDHGLTYLSQLTNGKNMAGVESDHHGRIALSGTRRPSDGKEFLALEDGTTLCALRHDSLCGKVPSGQGAHGGCTPEEVLVPIFIISNSPTVVSWTASLLTPEVSGTNARVRFEIKNIQSADKPFVAYNGRRYPLSPCGGAVYESADLQLDEKEGKVVLSIGGENRSFDIQVSMGVQEDELFGF